tara:strand:- start:1553 stop:2569 length:1017 start_codon:yes stop_codon:yes gene_type:complete
MEISVCIVGSGFGMYGLLPAFINTKNCNVVSICGKNSQRMEEYCKKFNLHRYDNWKVMLQKEKPDAVVIAVIPFHQYEIAKFALENNIAVFGEKPLTTSYETSLELYNLAKEKKLPNMIDFLFPEIPEWIKAKELIDDGKIGRISDVRVKWNFLSYDLKNHIKSWKTDEKLGGGALSFFFSHGLYYLEHFLGEIKDLQCNLSSSELSLNKAESKIDMIINFQSGCKGNVHVDISNSENTKHILEFNGSDGKLILQNLSDNSIDNFELILNIADKSEKIQINDEHSFRNDNIFEDSRVKVVSSLAKKFIKWCETGIPQKPDFQNGVRVQKMIQTAKNSN